METAKLAQGRNYSLNAIELSRVSFFYILFICDPVFGLDREAHKNAPSRMPKPRM